MLIFPDKIRSNNTLDYGIVDMIQISGSRTVQFTEDLFNISDAILSSNGTGDDAIGQCWFVSDDNKKYYLTNWNLRKTYSGWTSELLYSLGVGSEQAFQGSRGLELENNFNNLLTTFNGLSGLTYLTYIFNYDQILTTLNVSSSLNVSGVISGSSYYNLPIASYDTKGISSFNSNFFTVNNGVVSINPDIIGSGGLDEAQLQTYLESHGYVTSTYVNNRISSLVSSAPEALNTLNELALALGNDPNFATTVTNLISSKWTQDNTKIANWDLAYTNIHTHNNKSSLDLISSSGITNWNTAYSNSHTHSNKSDLDTITSSGITNWNTAYSNTHIHSNFNVLSGITFSDLLTQSNKDVLSHLSIVDGKLQADIDFYSLGEISAYNVGTGSTSGGTGGYDRLDSWNDYNPDPISGNSGFVLSAFLGYDLYTKYTGLTPSVIGAESYLGNPSSNGYLLSSTVGGVRSWVAPYSHPTSTASGTHTKVVVDSLGHVISGTTPTTLSGYSISDAYTKSYVDTYLQINNAGMSLLSGFTISGNQITVDSGKARLYQTTGFTGYVKEYSVSQASFTISTPNIVYFIVVDYNNGIPIYLLTTNRGIINYSNVIPVITLIYDGVKIHAVDWDNSSLGTAERLNKKLNRTDRFKRESGLSISVDANRYISITTGVIWFGVNNVTYPNVNSQTNNIYQYFHSGGTWNYIRSASLNNTQYDNGTNLVTLLNNNRYAVNWIYAGVGDDGDIFTLLGDGDYDLNKAISAQPPSSVPDIIKFHGILVGKVIYPYNSSIAASVISITDNITTAGGAILEHNNLNNIQGGQANEYYHLSSLELSAVQEYKNFSSESGTYAKVTIDSKGKVVSGTTLSSNDIPLIPWSKINSGTTPTTLNGYGITDAVTLNTIQTITGRKTFSSGITLTNGVHTIDVTIDSLGNLLVFGNIYATGEISAYNVGTGSTSSGTSTSLGSLVNVLDNVDDYDSANQYFLFRDSGATHWSKKLLSDLSVTWSNLAGKPTTLSGYGISVYDSLFNDKYSPVNHSHDYLNLTGLTISGGISGESAYFSSGITGSTGYFNNLNNNYVVKQSVSGLANSLIFDNGTNVGIGNTNTLYKLDVSGTFRATGDAYFNSALNISSSLSVSGMSTLSGITIVNNGKYVTLTVDSNGNLKLDNSKSNANFYASGEISAYNVGTGSTSSGTSTTLGGLVNVLDDVDDILPYQYFLFKDSGATHWSKKLLSDLSVTWSNLAGKPTTLSGYGVSVSDTLFDTKYAPFNHSHDYLSSSGGSISGVISGTSIILSSGLTSVNAVFTSGLTANKIFVSGLTNNFITKYSTTSGLTNSLIFDNGANVGIGNTNTTYKLDVSGTFRASGNSFFDSNVTISSGLTVNSESVLKGIRITNGIQSVTLTVDSNGRLKLDNASSGASFYATGEISAYGVSSGTTGSTGGGADYSRLDNWADYSVDKSGWVLSAKLGVDLNTRVSDLTNELNSLALNDLTDVDTTMSTQSTGEILVKEENTWKTKLYDFIRRPIMNVNGDVSETKEDYLLRVVGVYRYVGLSVVLKKDEIINDVLFTKNVRYEFVDGILDSDFKEVKAMELATSFDEIDDTKATSIALSKELYSLVMHIDGGNF